MTEETEIPADIKEMSFEAALQELESMLKNWILEMLILTNPLISIHEARS